MKRYVFITFYLLSVLVKISAQDSITIEICLENARRNHPKHGDQQILDEMTNNRVMNARTGQLPQMDLNGSATYQSDVIEFGLNIPGINIPVVPKDQYRISLDVNQPIYDGGMSRNLRKLETAQNEVDQAQLDLDIHTTLMQVKDLYFNILLIQENIKATKLSLSQLNENRRVVDSGIEHGVALKTDADLLIVEEISLEQRISEFMNLRQALVEMLSERTGTKLDTSVILVPASFSVPDNTEIMRKEEIILDLRSQWIEQNKALVRSRRLPSLYGFGQAGYGRPGLNMLNDNFDPYFIVGAKLRWNIFDWNTSSRNERNLSLQQKIIESSKIKLEQDIISSLISMKAEIKNHSENIGRYSKILDLRSNITSSFSAQLKEGVIKTIDLISAVNQEKISRIQLETEKILLQQSIARYLEIKGDL